MSLLLIASRWRHVVSIALLGLVVTGCGGTKDPLPTVTGNYGAEPAISMPSGNPPGSLVVRTLAQGNGATVQPDDYVVFNVQGKVWAGNREIVDSYTNHQAQGLPLSTDTMPAWRHLAGQRVGSRVLMVVPPKDGFGANGNSQLNVMGSDTLVFVFDVLAAFPHDAAATGKPVPYKPGPNMPNVIDDTSGPRIVVPSSASPPSRLISTVLREGAGPAIVTGQTAIVQYTGVVWHTGKVFDSTWTRKFPEAFQLGVGQVIPAWDQALTGQHVGSRVLLTVPPALGYGQQGNPPDIGSNDTLVFVVDILGAVA